MAAVIKPDEIKKDKVQDDSSENISTNPTDTTPFSEIAANSLSRRTVMQGSLAVAAAGFLAPKPGHAGTKDSALGDWFSRRPRYGSLLDFRALETADVVAAEAKTVTISPDYEYDVLIPWGTPIKPGVPEYAGDPNSRPTAEEQENQIGIGHDGMWFYSINLPIVLRIEQRLRRQFPSWLRRLFLSSRSGVLAVNHEFGSDSHVLGKSDPENLEDVRLSQAAHGVSMVVVAQNRRGKWSHRFNRLNRRITVNTPMAFSGPAAHSTLLDNKAGNEAAGTVNNCGSAPTPWGTYVTCEENFNGYFGTPNNEGDIGGFDELQDKAYARYGFSPFGFGYSWQNFDPRFDLSNPDYANESNRFGWCVEIDPFNPKAKPIKRTAMGRFKHESAAFKTLDDGRVAAYMGDDQRGDYCYKYESNNPWRHDIARGKSPLDNGKLYVAKFDEDAEDGQGTGQWIELTPTNPDIAAAGLTTMEQVLVYTRLAADAVGATPMDRPEWSTIGTEGQVFWTLTNNDRKDDGQGEISEANPIFENRDGHIISTYDTSTTTFTWNLFVLARNTRGEDPGADANDLGFAAYQAPADGGANVFTDPDAAWADEFGRLYIGTDGGQPDGLQDQLLVFDVNTGEYKRILSGVADDEITGITTTPNYSTLFTNTQHPGNGSPDETNFPAPFDGVTIPRDCTLVVRRKY